MGRVQRSIVPRRPASPKPGDNGGMSDATHDSSPETPAPALALAHDLAVLAEAAARAVGPYLRRVTRTVMTVDTKADLHDPVTAHDRRVEGALHTLLSHMVPASRVLGEETGEHTFPPHADPFPRGFADDFEVPMSPAVQGAIRRSEGLGARVRWIVDPIDGTANFASGLPWFNTSIGVELDGEVVAGAVHAPVLAETYVADLERAWMRDADGTSTPLRSEGPLREDEALLVSYHPGVSLFSSDPDFAAAQERRLVSAYQTYRRLGACALDLAMVAGGWVGCVVGTSFKPWDVAAGLHLVRVAGGRIHTEDFGTSLPEGLRPGIVVSVGTLVPSTALGVMSDYVDWWGARA